MSVSTRPVAALRNLLIHHPMFFGNCSQKSGIHGRTISIDRSRNVDMYPNSCYVYLARGLSHPLHIHTSCIVSQQRYSSKNKKKGLKNSSDILEDDDGDDDDDDVGDEDEYYYDKYYSEDALFPDNYKHVQFSVRSLRLDSLLVSAGFNISRSKIDDLFLASKLRLNGVRVLKKSIHVSEDDFADIITEKCGDKMKVKRIRVLKIKDRGYKHRIYARLWRGTTEVDNY